MMQCSSMQNDCRAAVEKDGARFCEALNDTNFGDRPCPFYKPQWRFEWELAQIAKGRAGFTPILLDKEAYL